MPMFGYGTSLVDFFAPMEVETLYHG